MKSNWFRILYVFLIALASSLVLLTTGCLSTIFVPLLMFAVPYYLKERKIRRYLINGIVVLLLCFVMVNLLHTSIFVNALKPSLSVQEGNATLSNGTVDPYEGSAGGNYSFSVIYTNSDTIQSSDVALKLNIIDVLTANVLTYTMTGNTAGPASNGWFYWINISLPEGFYYFNFTAKHPPGTVEIETPSVFGPKNAPWTTYASGLALNDLVYITFPFTLYLIVIGMYWWAGKARTMRGPARVPTDVRGGGFECTNCGAEVSESATKCPRCGAIFDEEEPVVRAKKVEKGRESEPEEKSATTKKEDWK